MLLKRIIQISFLVILSFSIFGCAYFLKGTNQNIYITSEPKEAEVYVNEELKGETPITLNLECKGKYEVVLKKKGYHSYSLKLKRKFGYGWLILDVINPFFYYTIIGDADSGAWFKLTPDVIDVKLIENNDNVIISYNNFQLKLKSIEPQNTYRLNI